MEIKIAKDCGLCYGVKRALRMARDTRKHTTGKVVTLGALIHNPQVISDLEKQAIFSIQSPDDTESGTVIIRSHGISPEIYERLKKKNIKIVDATCPIVQKIQQRVNNLTKEGEEIIIVGNKKHPESIGLIGYSRGKGIIIESEEQAKKLPKRTKRAVLAQSTQDPFLFERIVAALKKRTGELKIFNTICQSTQTQQKATSELAEEVDILFIIGGKNSSNTNKLYQVSKRILPNTYFIEKAEQITPEMLQGSKIIGLSGGASTPPEAIQEAVVTIKSCFEYKIHTEKDIQCQS
ncbi:MAG: 4-hydroxy-3-methylbut-2-enyl diphosphate reductase [Candidatus Aminicenantes bacterium]|nr:4-hydroxy-3-methylbut-2-enyl diphosphate reductase [Candidatus Aminicenantes bacterium]